MESNPPPQPNAASEPLPDDGVPIARVAPLDVPSDAAPYDIAPKYRSLITMSRALTIFASVGYLAATAIVAVGAYQTFLKKYYRADDMLGYLFFGLFVAAIAVFLHAVGACLKPFRDLVRNSFKNR